MEDQMDHKEIKDSILTYIKQEGYVPTVDDDGDIEFKKEGDLYWVIIDEKEESPFYLSIILTRRMGDDYDKRRAIIVAHEVNKKGVRVKLKDKSVWAEADMFFQDPKHFNAVFKRTTQIMLWAMDEFCEQFFG
jgi:hypothetical protein